MMLIPLAAVPLLEAFARGVFSGILARFASAKDELAGFGLGYALFFTLYSSCFHVDQMALAMGGNRRAFRRVMLVAGGLAGCLALLAAAVGLIPPLTHLIIDILQRSPDRATSTRAAFVVSSLAPLIVVAALAQAMRGSLIRARKAHWITTVSVVGRALSIVVALAIFRADFIQRQPLLLPVIASYVDGVTRLLLYLLVARRVLWPRLPAEGAAPGIWALLRFQYPLMITSIMMAVSFPIINAFVGALPDGKNGLAALAVLSPLATLFIIALGDIRVLPTAFHKERGALRAIRFYVTYVSISIFLLAAVFHVTPLSAIILRNVIRAPEDLIPICRSALLVTCLWPLAIATRGYLQGVSISLRATQTLTWSGPWRLAAIVGTMLILSGTAMPGAMMATVAMLAGFCAEAAAIAYFFRRLNPAVAGMEREIPPDELAEPEL